MVNPEFDSVRIVEIEFGEVTVRMLLAAMLIDANHDPSRPRRGAARAGACRGRAAGSDAP